MTQKLSEDIYLSERASLIEEERQQSRLYDRGILTLTAGAFGLSFFVLQQINQPKELWLIGGGWFGFGLSLVLTMISFLTSQDAYRKQVDILDSVQKSENEQCSDESNPLSNITSCLNWGSLFFFAVGAIFFAVFAFRNFN